jgi:hypothetical protein
VKGSLCFATNRGNPCPSPRFKLFHYIKVVTFSLCTHFLREKQETSSKVFSHSFDSLCCILLSFLMLHVLIY